MKLPKITKQFKQSIVENAKKGTYTIELDGFNIEVNPYVFPPQSPFSESSHTVYDLFGNLSEKIALDIGTGTAIQALYAVKAGAKKVIACDIEENAVKCAKKNVRINNLENKITVIKSDLFENIPEEKFDLIIANLPILDFEESDIRFHSLCDPRFNYHKRLFKDTKKYLKLNGKLVMCHANIQGNNSFAKLENMAKSQGYKYNIRQGENSIGYLWRNYEFSLQIYSAPQK